MRCFEAEMSALIFSALEQQLICRPRLLSLGEAVTLGQGCHIRQGCVTAQLRRHSTEGSCLPFCHPDSDDSAGLHPCQSSFFWASGRFILLTEIAVWLWKVLLLCLCCLTLIKKEKEMCNLPLWNSQTKASRKALGVVLLNSLTINFIFFITRNSAMC